MKTSNVFFALLRRIVRKALYLVGRNPNLFDLIFYKMFRNSKFNFNETSLFYYYSMHNETFRNERSVEIPIVMEYVKHYQNKKILEVGNVLNHYLQFEHTIVDKYEKGDFVLNYDITEFKPSEKYDLIVTISTLEHVGWDEYSRYGDITSNHNDPKQLLRAIDNMKQMLSPMGTIVATMPLGFNSYLDSLIGRNKLGFSEEYFMKRISEDNEWKQVLYSDVIGAKYADPYPCANSIIVGIFH
ncbi:hypothetical protein L6Q79_00115 [bacterium]|nr:hypothetical protein [bacterium]NUN46091.1 hypothetical protein [bacterium]